MHKPPVTALVLSRNEQDIIERCIRSLSWADEIVVIDDFSTDETVERCRALGCTVHQRHFDYYGNQGTWGWQFCRNRWVFQLDADEECTLELQDSILQLFESEPEHAAYRMLIRPTFMGKESNTAHGEENCVCDCTAGTGFVMRDPKHESIQVEGTVGTLQGAYFHHTFREMNHWIEKVVWYAQFGSETAFERNQKPSYKNLLLRPVAHFLNSYIRRLGFLDGKEGLIIAGCEAVTIFLRYCYLFEMLQQNNPEDYKPSQRRNS